VRGASDTRPYLSARGLAGLRERLSARDLAIVRQVGDLRLMSAWQIQALHFPPSEHENHSAAIRARQRVVNRLCRERLLLPLTRRIGGVRAGSAGLVLALWPVGWRILERGGARRRTHEPSWRFFDHTLALAQLVVDVQLAARTGRVDVLDMQTEPACWRSFGGLGGRLTLRPDAFLALGVGDYELCWFIEVDRATESLPTVLRKCRLYADYYQSGTEQAAPGGVFPRRTTALPGRLFVVTTAQDAINTFCEVTV
jgi:hypothetical protein